uniref:Uncharacterized protein n=1 Tax=Neisseria meningitidis alpha522 TaxID=996307 RepID=I4E849_NEIME|nr:hypothetical protein NMALPHA522_1976 [Neisseria meningitidis alpha522]
MYLYGIRNDARANLRILPAICRFADIGNLL